MRNHLRFVLAMLLPGMIALSCRKTDHFAGLKSEDPEAVHANQYSPPSNPSSPNLLFEEDVEGSAPFSNAHNWETGSWDYAIQFVNYPVYQGNKAVRFEIREDQPLVQDGKRSEIIIVKGSEGHITRETWYSFAIFFPADYDYDEEPEILSQWYQNGSPATTLRGLKDRVVLISGNTMDSRKTYDTGPIEKNAWTEFVFHFIHSHGSDGLIELWRNGTKVLTLNGGNMYDDVLPKWKIGLYKSAFKYNTSLVDKRVVYFDNVRVGNSNATYAEMTSGNVTPPPPPPPPTDTTNYGDTTIRDTTSIPPGSTQVVSYTLINATTDQEVMTITDGAQINLTSLGIDKINIRANTNSPVVKTVKMVMSGAYSRTRWDDAVPYALFGDDRAGDYYSWSPIAGNYTLKGSPYGGTKSSPGAPIGPEFTINFTLIK